jgi:gluconate 5-dehydrogenase
MQNIFNVKDKLVLITGSTQGIGYTLAKGFCEAEAKVIINGRDEKKVNTVVNELNKNNYIAYGCAFDVTNKEQVINCIEHIESDIGAIDVLVNNAGVHKRAPLENLTLDDWKTVIDTDLTSVFIVTQCVAKFMLKRSKGKIINITSLNSELARPTIANYCAAKGGLKMLTKSMAVEWGKFNIQTNAIGPGYMMTELTKVLAMDQEFDGWVKKSVPLGRWGNPDELIGAAIFLASNASSYINGHTIYIDGGWQASL